MNTLVKLPQGEWINLDFFRCVHVDYDATPVKIFITWDNGHVSAHQGEKAIAILEALEEAQSRAVSGGAIAQETLSEKNKEFAKLTAIAMTALALLSEAIESNGGSKAKQLIEAFTHKAKDFYANSSQEEVENFMDKYF